MSNSNQITVNDKCCVKYIDLFKKKCRLANGWNLSYLHASLDIHYHFIWIHAFRNLHIYLVMRIQTVETYKKALVTELCIK